MGQNNVAILEYKSYISSGKKIYFYIPSVSFFVWGRIEVCTGCWRGGLRERGH
jgi:hypothetical protein